MKDNHKTPDIDLSNEKSGNKSNEGNFQDLHREMVAQREKWWSEIKERELEAEKIPIGKTNFVRPRRIPGERSWWEEVVDFVLYALFAPRIFIVTRGHLATTKLFVYLRRNKKIRDALLWDDKSLKKLRSFDSWTKEEKDLLTDYYKRIDKFKWVENKDTINIQFGRSAHDSGNSFFVKRRGGIRDIYMSYVAQTLWMEVNGALKWKLLGFDQKQLEMLLSAKYLVDNRPAFSIQAHPNGDTVSLYSFSSAIPESPLFILDFLISTKAYWFYQGSPETCMKNALYALSRWFLHNLWHESTSINEKTWTVKEMLALNYSQDVKLKKYGKRYWAPSGCWSAAGLMHWCLRTMNIPSELIETNGHAGLSIRISQSEVLVVDALDDLFAWGDAWDPLIDPAPLFWTHAQYQKMYRGRPATQAFFASRLIRATSIPSAWFIHTLWERDPKRAEVAWDSYSSVQQLGKLGYPATELNRLFKMTHKKVQDIINGKVSHPWATEIKNRRLDRTKLANLLIAYRANRGKKPW